MSDDVCEPGSVLVGLETSTPEGRWVSLGEAIYEVVTGATRPRRIVFAEQVFEYGDTVGTEPTLHEENEDDPYGGTASPVDLSPEVLALRACTHCAGTGVAPDPEWDPVAAVVEPAVVEVAGEEFDDRTEREVAAEEEDILAAPVAPCAHPESEHRVLTYGTLCGRCGTKVG